MSDIARQVFKVKVSEYRLQKEFMTCFLNHYLIIGSYPDFSRMGGRGSGPGCGTDGLGQYKMPGIG